jgi:hypothetical protein
VFLLGITIINCSATDLTGNSVGAAFPVTVHDTTAPTIIAHANISAIAPGRTWTFVSYTSPATMDAVDGAGTASCSPVSGSIFLAGTTAVTCTAIDSSGNSASNTFHVVVTEVEDLSKAQLDAPSVFTTLADGQLINLDCNSVFWAFGVRFSLINLCDSQTTVQNVSASDLPANLPDGMIYMAGLAVDLLPDGKRLKTLPNGAGIQMDFPAPGEHKYAVLHWDEDETEWFEISAELSEEKISQIVNSSTGDEMYHLVDSRLEGTFCKILTTVKTGIFVLVTK